MISFQLEYTYIFFCSILFFFFPPDLSHQKQAVLLTGVWLPRMQTIKPCVHKLSLYVFGAFFECVLFQCGFSIIVIIFGYFEEVAEITFRSKTKKKIRARIYHSNMEYLQMLDFINNPKQKV